MTRKSRKDASKEQTELSEAQVEDKSNVQATAQRKCGLVMPISSIDGCSEQHWQEVKEIVVDAVNEAGLDAELVSYADEAGIIQNRIVQNLYENPIVICDVSAKNPNVMFELGMRLAFDKPTIVIKDDKTNYIFDTSPIEHLEYPRTLRHSLIEDFKTALARKVKATLEKAEKDPDYSPFIKHFGTFKVSALESTELPPSDYLMKQLEGIKRTLSRLETGKSHKEADTSQKTISHRRVIAKVRLSRIIHLFLNERSHRLPIPDGQIAELQYAVQAYNDFVASLNGEDMRLIDESQVQKDKDFEAMFLTTYNKAMDTNIGFNDFLDAL